MLARAGVDPSHGLDEDTVLQRLAVERQQLDDQEARAEAAARALTARIEQMTRDIDRETTLNADAGETISRLEDEAAELAAKGEGFAAELDAAAEVADLLLELRKEPEWQQTAQALLENILSLDYRRENIIQRLFDYGTVAINVGDIQLDFEHVAHPITVQNEIFERYNAAIKENELAESRRRRDDMVEFLAAYHEENKSDYLPPDEEETQTLH